MAGKGQKKKIDKDWINGTEIEEPYRSKNARIVNSKRYPNSFLYILQIADTSHFKIGVSQDPKRRIRDIRANMPYRVIVKYLNKHHEAYNLEEMLHDYFEDKKLLHEWFSLNKNDLSLLYNTLHDFSKEGVYLIKREQTRQTDLFSNSKHQKIQSNGIH